MRSEKIDIPFIERVTIQACESKGSTLASCLLTDKYNGRRYYAKSSVGMTIEKSLHSALKEKVALALYARLGISVPNTRIERLPIHYSYETYNNALLGLPGSRSDAYYLCSELLPTSPCEDIDLYSDPRLPPILAAGILLNDIDVLGGRLSNILIKQKPSAKSQFYKIDAGECFYPEEDVSLERIRYCTQGKNVYLSYNKFSPTNQQALLQALTTVLELTPAQAIKAIEADLGQALYHQATEIIAPILDFFKRRREKLRIVIKKK